MRRFTRLFRELDESNRTLSKVAAMRRYFAETPAADAAWGLWFLVGNRLPSMVRSKTMRAWIADLGGYPDWLVGDCYERVGDLAETAALLLPLRCGGTDESLAGFVRGRILPLRDWDENVRFQLMRSIWKDLDREQAFVVHKLLTGGFRVGVSKGIVIRALAETFDVERRVMAHRLAGKWNPDAAFFDALRSGEETGERRSRPYPFFLASPLEGGPENLGARGEWTVEWKWDGIRAQIVRRDGGVYLWSRGDELVSEAFPEITEAAAALPDGTVLDGEILCWRNDRPLGFHALQTRLNRRKLTPALLEGNPAAFLAYDCIEWKGADHRNDPLESRRAFLAELMGRFGPDASIRLSREIPASGWEDLRSLRNESRARGVEGMILKRRGSPYEAGRVRGHWWKWKVDPFAADLVMIYAQAGHGRRAGMFTDYTFAARHGDGFVPVAKAYSGLTGTEIREVDRWIKANTLARRGPMRTVPARQVFEIAFEAIAASPRHKSGLAVRFPRILRWRKDKTPEEADTLESLRALVCDWRPSA